MVDKFGVASLVIGIIIVAVLLQVYFMTPAVGGWTLEGLWNAISATVLGGVMLLGVCLVLIGLMLLVL